MIAILMATYNGEKYLREQIDSLLAQTYQDWKLYIHDDGSVDSTMKIISGYCVEYANKIIVMQDDAKHRGAAQSFLWLLEKVDAEYYMFCDQDDVWLPNKVEISYNTLAETASRLPAMAFSDLYVTDAELNIMADSMWHYGRMDKLIGTEFLYCVPLVTGCTIILNKLGRDAALLHKDEKAMHDIIVSLSIVAGKGLYIPIWKPLIYYRQHSNNVLGIKPFNPSVFSRFKSLKRILCESLEYYKVVHRIGSISFLKYLHLRIMCFIRVRI